MLWASRDVRDDSDDQVDTVGCSRHARNEEMHEVSFIHSLHDPETLAEDCPRYMHVRENFSPNCPSHDIHRSISAVPRDEMAQIISVQR